MENHELRLKINAAAAKRGSVDFVAAIKAIKKAVQDLERDSSGAFTKLNKRIKAVSTASNIKRGGGGGGGARGGAAGNRAAKEQLVAQNKVTRAVDGTRVAIERMVAQLIKAGDFAGISELTGEFTRFKNSVKGGKTSVKQFDDANTKLNTTMKTVQASLVTRKIKLDEEKRALKEGVTAEKQKEAALKSATTASKAAEQATAKRIATEERVKGVQLSAAQAMRVAEAAAEKLTQRLRNVGDNKRIGELNAALTRLRSNLSGSVQSTLQIRQAMDQYAAATGRVKSSLTATEASQRKVAKTAKELARAEKSAAAEARKVEREMRSVAGASNAADRAMRKATGSVRGLENAFSSTFQIGSAFRVMLGSITAGTFTKSVFAAGSALEQFGVTMQVATGSMQGAQKEIEFIDGLARKLGTGLRTAREDFSKFAVSSSLAGVSMKQTREIFESVSLAMSVLGKGTEDQRLAFLALEQMMSKGVISSEELRRQLGERLPGAVNLMAQAVGVSTKELQKMLKAGELISAEVLPKFAKRVTEAFGPGLAAATKRASFSLGTMRAEFEKFLEAVGKGGFMDALAGGFRDLTQLLREPDTLNAAAKLGEGLARVTDIGVTMAKFLITNINEVGRVAAAVLGGLVVRQIFLMANALVVGTQQGIAGLLRLHGWFTKTAVVSEVASVSMAKNTVTIQLNDAASLKAAASVNTLTAAKTRETAATRASTAANVGFFSKMGGFVGGLKRGAAGLVTFGAALAGFAGPIGIFVTALLLIPSAFSLIRSEADTTASEIEQAVRRAGVSFNRLESVAAETAGNITLANMFKDLETLGKSVERFTKEDVANLSKALKFVTLNLKAVSGSIGDFEGNTKAAHAIGLSTQQLDNLSMSAKRTVKDLLEMTLEAQKTGTGFLELRSALAKALIQSPNISPVIGTLSEFTTGFAEAEFAITETKAKLIEFYGTKDDVLVKSLLDASRAVVRTGKGFSELRIKAKNMSDEFPAIATRLKDIIQAVDDAQKFGQSEELFFALQIDGLSTIPDELVKYREAIRLAEESTVKFAETVDTQTSTLSAGVVRAGKALQLTFGSFEVEGLFADASLSAEEFEEKLIALTSDSKGMPAVSKQMEFAIRAAVDFKRAMIANGASVDVATKAMNDYLNGLSNIRNQSSSTVTAITTMSGAFAEMGRLAAETATEIGPILKRLRVEADISRIVDPSGVKQAIANAEKEGGDLFKIRERQAKELAELERQTAAVSFSSSPIAGRSDILESRKLEQAKDLAEAIKNITDKTLNSRKIKTSRSVSQLSKDLKKLREEARDTDTEIGKLARTSGTLTEALGKGAIKQDEATKIMKSLTEQTAEAIAEENNLGEAYLTTAEVMSLSRAEGAALLQVKILEQALRNKNIDLIGNETAEILKNVKAKALEKLQAEARAAVITSGNERLKDLQEEGLALKILSENQELTAESATLMAQAMMANGGVLSEQTMETIRLIEAQNELNEAMKRAAKDPVREWMKAVPTWKEGADKIKVEAIESLSSAISDFALTGKFDLKSLGESITRTASKIISDQAVKEMLGMFGVGGKQTPDTDKGLMGTLFGSLFNTTQKPKSSSEDPLEAFGGIGATIGSSSLVEGRGCCEEAFGEGGVFKKATESFSERFKEKGKDVATGIGDALKSAGKGFIDLLKGAFEGAGNLFSSIFGSLGGSSSGGGDIFGDILGMGMSFLSGGGGGGGSAIAAGGSFNTLGSISAGSLPFSFKEGGISSSPSTQNIGSMVDAAVFRHAPSFATGTTNTSGIPAILHDNEAVVPLSGNRSIPVDLGDTKENSQPQQFTVNFNLPPNADVRSFQQSEAQVTAQATRILRNASRRA